VNILCLVLCTVFSVLCPVYFSMNRRWYERLLVRQSEIVFECALGVMCFAMAGPLNNVIYQGDYPCWLRMSFMIMVPPFVGGSFVLKLLIFFLLDNFTRAKYKEEVDQPEWNPNATDAEFQERTAQDLIQRKKENSACQWLVLMCRGLVAVFKSDADRKDALNALKFLIGPRGMIFFIFCMAIPFLILAIILIISVPAYSDGCYGCSSKGFWLEYIGIVIILLCFGMVLAYFTYHLKDPWGLATEVRQCLMAIAGVVLGFILSFAFENDAIVCIGVILQTLSFCTILWLMSFYQVRQAHRKEGRLKKRVAKKKKAEVPESRVQISVAATSLVQAGATYETLLTVSFIYVVVL